MARVTLATTTTHLHRHRHLAPPSRSFSITANVRVPHRMHPHIMCHIQYHRQHPTLPWYLPTSHQPDTAISLVCPSNSTPYSHLSDATPEPTVPKPHNPTALTSPHPSMLSGRSHTSGLVRRFQQIFFRILCFLYDILTSVHHTAATLASKPTATSCFRCCPCMCAARTHLALPRLRIGEWPSA